MHVQPVFQPEFRGQRSGVSQHTTEKSEQKAANDSQITDHRSKFTPSIRIVGGKVSEGLFEQGLCLPSGTAMDKETSERIIKVIRGTMS